MAISDGLCRSYLREAVRGVHQHDDDYRIALYGEGARAAVSDLPWATAAGEARVTARGCAAASDIRHAQAVSDRAVTITKDDDLLLLLGLFDAESA